MSGNTYVKGEDIQQYKTSSRVPEVYMGYVSGQVAIGEEYWFIETTPVQGMTATIRLSRRELTTLHEQINQQLGSGAPLSDDELRVRVSITTPAGQRVTLEGDINGEIAYAS